MQKHFEEEKKDVGTVALDTSSSTHGVRAQDTEDRMSPCRSSAPRSEDEALSRVSSSLQ